MGGLATPRRQKQTAATTTQARRLRCRRPPLLPGPQVCPAGCECNSATRRVPLSRRACVPRPPVARMRLRSSRGCSSWQTRPTRAMEATPSLRQAALRFAREVSSRRSQCWPSSVAAPGGIAAAARPQLREPHASAIATTRCRPTARRPPTRHRATAGRRLWRAGRAGTTRTFSTGSTFSTAACGPLGSTARPTHSAAKASANGAAKSDSDMRAGDPLDAARTR